MFLIDQARTDERIKPGKEKSSRLTITAKKYIGAKKKVLTRNARNLKEALERFKQPMRHRSRIASKTFCQGVLRVVRLCSLGF